MYSKLSNLMWNPLCSNPCRVIFAPWSQQGLYLWMRQSLWPLPTCAWFSFGLFLADIRATVLRTTRRRASCACVISRSGRRSGFCRAATSSTPSVSTSGWRWDSCRFFVDLSVAAAVFKKNHLGAVSFFIHLWFSSKGWQTRLKKTRRSCRRKRLKQSEMVDVEIETIQPGIEDLMFWPGDRLLSMTDPV